MDDSDSDSSGGEGVVTNVLLGFASKAHTIDDFSQLGSHPVEVSTKVYMKLANKTQ